MLNKVDLFYNAYANFTGDVLKAVRDEAFGTDIGQNSWLTAEEYDLFTGWLGLDRHAHVLEVASGSGGPALHLAKRYGCRVRDEPAGAVQGGGRHHAPAVQRPPLRCAAVHRLDESFSRPASNLSRVVARLKIRSPRDFHGSGGHHRAR